MFPQDFGFRDPAAQNVSAEISVSGSALLQMFAPNFAFLGKIFSESLQRGIGHELPPKAELTNAEYQIQLTWTPKELVKRKCILGPEAVEVTHQILRLISMGQAHQIYLFQEHILANLESFLDLILRKKPLKCSNAN